MKISSLLLLLLLTSTVYSQNRNRNDFLISNAEQVNLYRNYDNKISYSASKKMDSVWIECDSADVTYHFKNFSKVVITSKTVRMINVVLKGKRRKKEYTLGSQKFKVYNIPYPKLLIGRTRIDNNINEKQDDEIFERRMFLITPSITNANTHNKIVKISVSIGSEEFIIHQNRTPIQPLIKAFQAAPAGTSVHFNYYVFTGTGGYKNKLVNLGIFYIKKNDPE